MKTSIFSKHCQNNTPKSNMENQCLNDIGIYQVPTPIGLTTKILTNQAKLQDFVDYDDILSSYLSLFGKHYLVTNDKVVKRYYKFLAIVIQQFKNFITYVANTNFNYSYKPNYLYKENVTSEIKDFFFMSPLCYSIPAKFCIFPGEKLPPKDIKLCYDWLTTIIEMEETFSPLHTLFSAYQHFVTSAVKELIDQKWHVI